ncbi:hypothetical protein [Pseudomonas sp. Leaf129]|uniref:hypothetical protein n=1 Tax=Pseudomonas sp. Leaf129 TaxID=1736268 RepID=UPI000AF4D207|nr:hypothetical protein [Pseudomonas sp. Leaf129]
MSWKDHPIPVAAVTCVATLGVCYKLLMPIYTSVLENEVLHNRSKITGLQEELSTALERIKKLEIENSILISDSALKLCNPYPIGLDFIKVGDPLQKVVDQYSDPKHDIDNNKGFIVVKFPGNKIIRSASYIAIDGKKIVSIIFFYSDVKFPNGKEKLQESPQQLGMLKQVKDAFPNAVIVKRNDPEAPGYDVALGGKKIISINPTNFNVDGTMRDFSNCKR